MTQTPEEAAKEYARSYAFQLPATDACKDRVLASQEEGFLAGWHAAQQAQWVSVKEGYPEEDEVCSECGRGK